MITQWLAASGAIVLTAVFVFVPGLVALRLVGLRGLALVAFAPVMSTAMTAVAALGLGVLRVPWSLASYAAAMVVFGALAWILGRVLGRVPAPPRSERRWLLPVAVGLGILFGLWRLAAYINEPGAISQTNDAVFHLNAIRNILETESASSMHVSAVIGGRGFYPAAWHGLVSLSALVGVDIAVAVNAMSLVIAAVVWPVGIAWLTRVVTGSERTAAVAAILSAALQTFPLLMFQWGVLYPNGLSTALLPAAIALVLSLPAWSTAAHPWCTGVRHTLLLGIAVGALVLAQPAALLAWGAVAALWFTVWFWRRAVHRGWRLAAIAAVWLVLGAVWVFFSRSTTGSHWPPFRGKAEVFLDVLFNGQVLIPFAWGISALMLVGLVVTARTMGLRWFAVAWLGLSALYVLVAAVGAPLVRVGVFGAWYADPYRIAALAPIVVIPLAAIGLGALAELIARWMRREARGTGALVTLLAVASVFMIVLILTRPVAMPKIIEQEFDTTSRYSDTGDDVFLDPQERALLEQLDDWVPAGERVIANPSTGSGFGYMLSGVDVYPRTWATPRTASWAVLSASLRDAATDPAVCAALADYGNPGWVLDFGIGEDTPGRFIAPGMTDFAGQPGFARVAEVGEASLWRITACAR